MCAKMSALSRTLLSVYYPFIAPTIRRHSSCLLLKKRCFEIHNYKYASTAKFPSLVKERTNIKCHDDLHRFSIENPEEFWSLQARDFLTWQKLYSSHRVMDCDMQTGHFRWFDDGQLNASVNCVDR